MTTNPVQADDPPGHGPTALVDVHLYSCEGGSGTTRYYIEAERQSDQTRIRLMSPDGFAVAAWRPDANGDVRGQWISPFADLYVEVVSAVRVIGRMLPEPASQAHRSLAG
jgi:hypothetical protein